MNVLARILIVGGCVAVTGSCGTPRYVEQSSIAGTLFDDGDGAGWRRIRPIESAAADELQPLPQVTVIDRGGNRHSSTWLEDVRAGTAAQLSRALGEAQTDVFATTVDLFESSVGQTIGDAVPRVIFIEFSSELHDGRVVHSEPIEYEPHPPAFAAASLLSLVATMSLLSAGVGVLGGHLYRDSRGLASEHEASLALGLGAGLAALGLTSLGGTALFEVTSPFIAEGAYQEAYVAAIQAHAADVRAVVAAQADAFALP